MYITLNKVQKVLKSSLLMGAETWAANNVV